MRDAPGTVQFESDAITRLASTRMVHLGSETRPPNAVGWDSVQTTGLFDVVAFSFRPVRVVFEGERPVVLCPGVVALPGASTAYRRTPVGRVPQRTVFIGLRGYAFIDLVAEADPALCDRLRRGPPLMFAPADARASTLAWRLARLVFSGEGGGAPVEAMLIDETVLEIVGRTVGTLRAGVAPGSARRRAPSPGTQRRWREIANSVAATLTTAPEPPSIEQLADDHDLSPAYLTRIFRHELGQTMHDCSSTARLLRALEHLPDAKGRLTQLAHASGFASHAHMTGVFRSALGVTPSGLAADSAAALRAGLARAKKQ